MTTLIHPLFAANAAVYAIQNATTEGKITVLVLLVLSLFSWTIIITKFRQLSIARRAAKKFLAAYSSTRDPLDILRKGEEFEGAPAYQLYVRGADELVYQLKNNPVQIQPGRRPFKEPGKGTRTILRIPSPPRSVCRPSTRCAWFWRRRRVPRPCRWKKE